MRKLLVPALVGGAILGGIIAGATIAGAASSNSSSYADDRAAIQDLQARYLFALDWGDADTYASTFTPDGVLDYAGGVEKGRKQIHDSIMQFHENMVKAGAVSGLRPSASRHNITNMVIKVDGNHATGRAYWVEFSNNNPKRKAELAAYGHYEDSMEKIDGKWYFTKRKILNEQLDDRPGGPNNPAW